ncbi:hypothetical protein FOH10_07070 [Nocardia otitidiscaviarum]|uniref:PPE domain-containing protein n=1 Tax=Nocardia otitidiscaviarum TaxID=1823 RepID=A0A516NHZ4_9NOCA|nr:hypothetical protein [Nocardia otitidiscaviarum]MCP9619989.1 hypothetical protein [Nocardia otitidiscaviarum]QDP78537.1 hypothetical protein FOH10_07070 [Nocardia otitidiscaviarum]
MDPESLHAGTAARRAQRGAEREQRRISHAGVDPDYIWRMERFTELTHAEIHARVRAMDPAAMHESADTWVGIADSLSGAATGLHMTVQSALAEALRGQIAEAAEAAARAFVARAMDIAEVARNAGHRITAAAYGAEAVRRTVPPPPDAVAALPDSGAALPDSGATLPDSGAPAAGVDATAPLQTTPTGIADPAAERFAEEQYQLALAALEANYVPIYPPAGSGVPAFEPAPSSPDGSDDGAATTLPASAVSGGPISSGNPAAYGNPSDVVPVRKDPPPSMTTDPTAAVVNSPALGHPNAPSGTDHGVSEPPPPASPHGVPLADPATTPSGVTPDPTAPSHSPATPNPTAVLPYSTAPGPTTALPNPATPGSTALPGAPGTSASPPAPGDPGRSIPSQPTGRTTRIPTFSDSTPRAGGSWLPAMYPPMTGSGGDQDAPRTTPAWLVWNREQELLGDPPPCAHGVIGADIPAARPCTGPE